MDPLQVGEGTDIGPFRLLGRLGEGGMGRVYLGESPGGRKVAIKVIHPHYAADPEFRRRFAREVAAARLVGGFHAAQVVDADPDAALPWMATAYIPGPSLADAVGRSGPLGEARVRELGAALAEGLGAIHACGLIHRDLKPGNIILADDGPRVIDFGIAKGVGATTLTGPSAIIGTLQYMSPEQLNGEELTPGSDVFALGSVLAYAATGHEPFSAPAMPAVINLILNDSPNLDLLAGDLRDIIDSCLAKSASARPALTDLITRLQPRAVLSAQPAAPAEPAAPTAPAVPVGPTAPPLPGSAGPPPASTIDVSVATASRQAALKAPAPGAGRPARRRGRRRSAIAAVGAVAAAVALAVPGVRLLDKPRAGSRPPAAASSTAAQQAAATRPTAATRQATGTLLTTMTDPQGSAISAAVFAPVGVTLVTDGGRGGGMDVWNTATRNLAGSLIPPNITDPIRQFVTSVAYAPSGSVAAAGDSDGSTTVWNTATGQRIATLTEPPLNQVVATQEIDAVALAPGGVLATGGQNGITYLWNIVTGKVTATVGVPNAAPVGRLAFAPDGGTLAISHDFGGIDVWSAATKKIIASFQAPGGKAVRNFRFTDAGTLAVVDEDGRVYLWNIASNKTVTLSEFPYGNYVSLASAAGGLVLATTDGNHQIFLWNTVTEKLIGTITDPNGAPSQEIEVVAFQSDGATLAASDGGVTLWHVAYKGP